MAELKSQINEPKHLLWLNVKHSVTRELAFGGERNGFVLAQLVHSNFLKSCLRRSLNPPTPKTLKSDN